jgi:3-dehydroquinate synthase class II
MDGQNDMKLINFIRDSGFDGMIHIENNPQQLDEKGNEETTTAIMIFNAEQAKLVKYAGTTTSFSDIMFLKNGGKLEDDDLLSEIKKLRK